jgi:transcriptional regulator with XRE-family HTH domain
LAFGREVRRRRSTLGLTLEQLAERSDLTPNYIGSVENGRRDPSLSTVLALAKGLGVGPAELLGGRDDLGPVATEAAALMEQVSPDLQVAVLELLRVLARKRR